MNDGIGNIWHGEVSLPELSMYPGLVGINHCDQPEAEWWWGCSAQEKCTDFLGNSERSERAVISGFEAVEIEKLYIL